MRRTRRVAVQVHLYLGLLIGLLWSLQGLTGAALVFHREIDRWAHPEWRGELRPALPADRLIAIAERSVGTPVSALGVLDAGQDLRTATYKKPSGEQVMLILDGATGRIVGERQPRPARPTDGSTSRFVYMLHQKLVAGDTGEWIVGISGCLLLSTTLLGVWMAWPRRGNWRAMVSRRAWKTTAQKLYSWHRLAGLVFAAVFVAVAMGGIYMTFSDGIRASLRPVVSLNPPLKVLPLKRAGNFVPAQQALDSAMRRFPGATFVRLAVPSADKPYYQVRLRQPGETRAWAGATAVTVDAIDGKLLDVADGLRGPMVERVLDAQFSIHNGEVGGLAGRLLIMMAGIALPTFYLSGLALWIRKRALKRKL